MKNISVNKTKSFVTQNSLLTLSKLLFFNLLLLLLKKALQAAPQLLLSMGLAR